MYQKQKWLGVHKGGSQSHCYSSIKNGRSLHLFKCNWDLVHKENDHNWKGGPSLESSQIPNYVGSKQAKDQQQRSITVIHGHCIKDACGESL